MKRGLVTITLLLVAGHAWAGTLLLHDPSSKLLSGQQSASDLSPAAATAVLCAASALIPPYELHGATSKQVEGIVQRDVFHRPKAVVLLHVAGMSPDSPAAAKLQQLLGEGNSARLTVADAGVGSSAGSLLQAASDIVTANPDAAVTLLDLSSLRGCHTTACLNKHLSAAADHCGGKLHQQQPAQGSSARFSGQLQLPGLERSLDLASPAARLFGLELAGLQGATQQALTKLQDQQEQQEVAVFEGTFVGLQALAATFGQGSAEVAAAESALAAALGHAAQQLQAAYGDNLLHQVALLGDVAVSSGKAAHLQSWKELARRVLLQRAGLALQAAGDEPAGAGKAFASKATAYAVTLILLWFTFAGVYCMVSMRFKQDTLLYGRSKSD